MHKQLSFKFLMPLMILFAAVTIFSCKKDDVNNPTPNLPDLQSRVTSSVSGFVSDENNLPVSGATVKVGSSTSSTDEYGFFSFRDVQVVKNAAVVTVTHSGYFKGMRTYIAEAGKSAVVRIKLLPKTTIGSIDGAAGGSATAADGLKVELPASGVVDASGAAYTGPVTVSAKWLNPAADDFAQIMPGDLRALNTSGEMRTLLSYGMAAVELTGSGGQALQVAPGKKSTVSFPLPSTLQGPAPASIPLWHFDEEKGLWIEEGTATKVGDKYVGEVSHFSFWNCDVPANYVQFNVTVHDANGNPVPWAVVKLTMVNSPFTATHGITDSSGYVNGAIPANTDLVMTVFSGYNCGSPLITQTIPGSNTNISLGTITLPAANMATVSGTITNCAMQPVTDGYVIMNVSGIPYRYPVDNTGAFTFSFPICAGNSTVTIIAEDIAGSQQSTPVTHTLTTGANALGNLQACGVTTSQFMTYTVNGNPYTFTAPGDSLYMSGNGTNNMFMVGAFQVTGNRWAQLAIERTGIGVGTAQEAYYFQSSDINDSTRMISPPNIVNITEYGNIGEFISGNYNLILTGEPPTNQTYTVNGSFRVRRTW